MSDRSPNRGSRHRGRLLLLFAWLFLCQSLGAQTLRVSDVDQRVGPRTEFQKPIAWDVAGHTVLVEGITAAGGQVLRKRHSAQDLFGDQDDEYALVYEGVYDLRIAKKLPTTFTYGFNGRILLSGVGDSVANEERFDVYLRNYFGQFSYGNFDDRDALVFSARSVLAGEANLFFDGFFAPSTDRAFRFRSRVSSYLIDAAIDEDGDAYNVGVRFGSPNDYVKNFWSLNYQGGDLLSRYHRHGLSAGYLLSYGSLDIAFGLAYDQLDPYANFATFDRLSGSLGISYKFGATTLAAGALLGETNGGPLETAYTAGFRYDFVRGLSFNAGYFYIDSESTGSDGEALSAGNVSGVRTSLSYRF